MYEFNDDNTESKRLRDLLYNIYTQSDFGNRVVRGFLVKRMGDEVLAEHCSDVCFQPLSTLKLLPYLYTMIEVDKGNATMNGTSISWIQPTTGTPAAISDTSCLKASDPNTQAGSAKLKDALPTMMWESHNRTLDSILNKYGPANITTRGQSLALRQTEMYFGCAQPSGPQAPWADNISTLIDMAHLFEGVENLTFVTNATSRQAVLSLNTENACVAMVSPLNRTCPPPRERPALMHALRQYRRPGIRLAGAVLQQARRASGCLHPPSFHRA